MKKTGGKEVRPESFRRGLQKMKDQGKVLRVLQYGLNLNG